MSLQRTAKATGILLAVILLVGAAFLSGSAWLAAPVAHAQEAASANTLPRTITVVGEGMVRIQPDTAQASIGVEVLKPSVKEASAENKAVLAAVLEALEAQGIEAKDIQTSGFSIFAERYGPEGPLPADQTQYRVSNNVTVTIRNLDTVGDVLDAAIEAGANNIYGVTFSLDDSSAAESEARGKAVEDGKAKAAELAELNGVALGPVISVSEVIGLGGGYYASNFAGVAMPMMGGGGGAPISPGELQLTMQLQITYAIAE